MFYFLISLQLGWKPAPGKRQILLNHWTSLLSFWSSLLSPFSLSIPFPRPCIKGLILYSVHIHSQKIVIGSGHFPNYFTSVPIRTHWSQFLLLSRLCYPMVSLSFALQFPFLWSLIHCIRFFASAENLPFFYL